MRRILCILLTLLLVGALLPAAVSAASTYSRLTDSGNLLSSREEQELLEQLDEISQRQQFDVVVVTVDSIPAGSSVWDYADDFFDRNGFGQGSSRDGCLLLISMEERDWYISTRGYGITAFTDAGIQYIGEQMIENGLSDGDYLEAFQTYARLCDDFVTQAREGRPYDVGNLPKEPTPWALITMIAVVLGCGLAFVPVSVMKAQMKSVKSRRDAGDYVQRGSLQLTRSRDVFLYRNVTRTAIPRNEGPRGGGRGGGGSSVHTSSSGARHGGGGGKF